MGFDDTKIPEDLKKLTKPQLINLVGGLEMDLVFANKTTENSKAFEDEFKLALKCGGVINSCDGDLPIGAPEGWFIKPYTRIKLSELL